MNLSALGTVCKCPLLGPRSDSLCIYSLIRQLVSELPIGGNKMEIFPFYFIISWSFRYQ